MHAAPAQPLRPDLALAAVARRQHGVWTSAQAYQAGLSRSMIRTRVSTGRWIRLDRAVYADVSSLPTWRRQVTAAILAERWAAASHRTSAGLRRLEGFPRSRVEVTVPPGANARGRLALVHRGIDVEVEEVDGIRCTSLAQTFVDLAQVVSVERIIPALDAVVAARPVDLDAVRARYVALAPRGGRNLRPLRTALERYGDGAAASSSELERVLRTTLDHPAIPPVRWEAPFPGRRTGAQRVDGLIPEWGLVIEGDGRAWHTRVDDFERDRRRDAEAAAAGYQTLRFSWSQLTREPDWVRATVASTGCHRRAA